MRIVATLILVVGLVLACGVPPVKAQRGGTSCQLAVLPMSFGNYNVFNTAPTDFSSSVSFNCSARASIKITLGSGKLGTFARCDTGCGAYQLYYNLYLDASRSVIWGDQSHYSVYSNSNTPRNTWVYVTAYGRIPAGQDATAGSYSDSVVVTIIY